MREPMVDVMARMMVTSRDRRRLLGVLAGALVGGAVSPRPARADSRDQCQDKRERCKDRARAVCSARFLERLSPIGLAYPREYGSMCQNNAISQCCEKLYDWKPREGDDGECASDQDIDPCVDRVIRELEAGYWHSASRGPGESSRGSSGRPKHKF